MQQEELARLFSANMSLSQVPPQPAQTTPQPAQQVHEVPQAPAQQEQEQPTAPQPIIYASQHYTHSHHVTPLRHVVPIRFYPPQPTKTQIDDSALEGILLRNSIDPSLLFPSQVDLFQNADDDQRLRLLELWRISPPTGRQGFPQGVDYNTSRQLYDWPPTSLAQEEAMAKLRYERMMEESAQAEEIQAQQQQMDQSMDENIDTAAVMATREILGSSPDRSAEPYIVSGYDMLARREYDESATAANHLKESTRYNQATDPVYDSGKQGLWEKNVGSVLDMENNYGAFAAARERDVQPMYADHEMVM